MFGEITGTGGLGRWARARFWGDSVSLCTRDTGGLPHGGDGTGGDDLVLNGSVADSLSPATTVAM